MLLAMLLGCGRAPAPCEPPGTQVPSPRAAGCVVVVDHEVLLVQQLDGRWTIPAGYVDPGEDSAQAAVRETWEEAKVRVRAGPPYCAVPANRFVAHACVVDGAPAPAGDGSETRDARFFGRDALAALPDSALRFPAQRAAWLRALE
ncbi:MAG: NUDIX domain-containing protein [Myxococcota bacterium]